MIERNTQRLEKSIEDLLQIAKIQEGITSINREWIPPNQLIDPVIDESRSIFEGKKIKVETKINDKNAIYVDPEKIRLVISNLLSNAIKFTDSGIVTVTAVETGDGLSVSVIDTGIGIDKSQFATIFNSFEQGSGNAERAYSGTGLGLSVSKQLVQLHGGEITVESEPDEGSTFTFTLPTCDEIPQVNAALNAAAHTATYSSTNKPANPATIAPKAMEIRKGHGSPIGQSTPTNRTAKAYAPRPQKPTTPKLAILAKPICR